MQQDPENYSEGVIKAAKDIIKSEGVGFLLAGLGIHVTHTIHMIQT